jgi:cystathionine beta-lyase/cystathionine gamma-synthase
MSEHISEPGLGQHTRAVHWPTMPAFEQQPLALPVHRSSTFAFETSQDFADVLADAAPGYSYGRIDSPTADGLAAAVAALEAPGRNDISGQAFASGMAAITAALLANASAGSHLVIPQAVYGGTFALVAGVLARFGVEYDSVDLASVASVRAALRESTTVIWAETLANPTMAVADIPALADVAHEAGARLIVDSTFATPAVCRPLEHGADLVVHSATKYIGGHSDATGGVVVGPRDLMRDVRAVRVLTGGALAPDEAYLLHRGLSTLPLRVDRHCSNALLLARAIAGHRNVVRVDYPGLSTHPDHELAGRLFDKDRFGAVVTVTPIGGRAAGMEFVDRLSLIITATSLGGTHSLASHVASTSHRQLNAAELAAAGIGEGSVRISVGLEDPDDLIADAIKALDRLDGFTR